jgi:leucine-rich PPR motif-containing protein
VLSDAVQFLTEQSGERKLEDRSFQYGALCWRLLNSLAEEGKVEDLRQVFDTLVKYEYIEANNVLLGPLIKVHIVRQVTNTLLTQFIALNVFLDVPFFNTKVVHNGITINCALGL